VRNADSGSRNEEGAGAEDQSAIHNAQSEILKGLSVLVVDDEPDALGLIKAVLEMKGARVTAVGSADAAWGALGAAWPDLLLCDIGMAGEDGYQFIRRVRALGTESGRALPSVALTAYAGEADRALALEAGFHLHVAKPVEPTNLVSVITGLVGKGS
jgi:CheY-like chemotaxis protein